MTILQYSMKRLLRKRVNLLFMLVIAPLMTGLIFGLTSWGPVDLKVGLVDNDNTLLTESLRDTLGQSLLLKMLKEEDIRSVLASSQVDYVLVIETGFTTDLLNNTTPSIRGHSIQESNMALPVKVKSFISAATNLAFAATGNEDLFY